MNLMQEIEEMDPEECARRPEVKSLWDKGLLWSIAHRRSARNPLGVEVVKDGFFDYQKVKDPVPLTAEELAILCWAGAGTNGLERGDGRVLCMTKSVFWEATTNCSCAYRWYHLFFNTEDGLYLYKRHVPTRVFEVDTQDDLETIFRAFKEGVVRLGDSIIENPSTSPAVLPGNDLFTFQPGTVQFFLISDSTTSFMCATDHICALEVPEARPIIIDDATEKPAGVQKWIDKGYLKGPHLPLSYLENMCTALAYKDINTCLQNLSLCSTAMGLGIFPHIANMQIMMGNSPFMRGLGFRWTSDKRGNPYPVGIDGIFEGHLPPYMDMDQAVDDYFNIGFGPKGSFNQAVTEGEAVIYTGFSKEPREVHRPYKNPEKWLEAAKQYWPTPEQKQLLKDLCNYIYNTYGRYPLQIDPFICPYIIQVHHIDPEFYQEYWIDGAVTREHSEHLSNWH